MSEGAKEKLLHYDYPGNVRELENIIMGAMSMVDDEHILMENHLIMEETTRNEPKYNGNDIQECGIDEYLSNLEKEIIINVLDKNNHNISKTANALKIKRQTLQHKIKKYSVTIQ